MFQSLLRTTPRAIRPSVQFIHTNGAGEVPKTEANTGSKTKQTPKTTHHTGSKGDGDMPHPKEYVDQLQPTEGNEASPEKQPTRSTGIKSEHEGDSKEHK